MPGISIVSGRRPVPEDTVNSSLESVCFSEDYSITHHISNGRASIAHTGYSNYPVHVVESADGVTILEGHLYDVDDVETVLRRVGNALARGESGRLANWLADVDGDFLIARYEKERGTVHLLNDTLSRLPTYTLSVGNRTIVSRELKFIREFARLMGAPLELDSMGVAQTLLFGYRLGNRTLFDGVERIPPAATVEIDDEITVEQLHQHNFGQTAHADKNAQQNAANLVTLFENACADRNLPGHENVISLSGGLDSRAVAGGYDAAGVPFSTATFEKANGSTESDVRVAKAVSDALGVEWDVYQVDESDQHRETLLDMKQGMNFLAMAFIVDFFERLNADTGPMVYITGDGGDKALPDITPPKTFRTEAELVRYIVEANSIFTLQEAVEIADVERDALLDTVRERVRRYPESDLTNKYVHFLVRERGINWLNHGEDRNRYYFWSVSPYYSLPFFEYAMNCPTDQKRHNELYVEFMSQLSPQLVDIEYANAGAPVTSTKYRLKQFAVDTLGRYPRLRRKVVKLLKNNQDPDRAVVTAIHDHLAENDVHLSRRKVAEHLDTQSSYGVHGLYHLFTITSLVAEGTQRAVPQEQ